MARRQFPGDDCVLPEQLLGELAARTRSSSLRFIDFL
jgi:hypothetical protein